MWIGERVSKLRLIKQSVILKRMTETLRKREAGRDNGRGRDMAEGAKWSPFRQSSAQIVKLPPLASVRYVAQSNLRQRQLQTTFRNSCNVRPGRSCLFCAAKRVIGSGAEQRRRRRGTGASRGERTGREANPIAGATVTVAAAAIIIC